MTLPKIDDVSFLVEHAQTFFAGEQKYSILIIEHALNREPVPLRLYQGNRLLGVSDDVVVIYQVKNSSARTLLLKKFVIQL